MALRRTARLRREYLYRKSLEGAERAAYEKRRAVRVALAEGKPVPTELRQEAAALKADGELEDVRTAAAQATGAGGIDDEYAHAAERAPRVLVTTSREPSSRLAQFAKELKLVFPNAERINRGNMVVADLVESCRKNDFTDIVVVHETRGEPDGLVICHLPFGPTVSFGVSGAVLRHDIKDRDIGTVSEAYPHLILDGFGSKLGDRVKTVLRHLFPEPKADSKRVVTFANQKDFVSFRHHTYAMPRGKDSVELKEVGPRFEMRLYQVRLGTLDQPEAELEFALRPYMRSGKKLRL